MTGAVARGPLAANTRAALLSSSVFLGTLIGCASVPSSPSGAPSEALSPSPSPVAPAPQSAYELQLRERALAFARRDRFADAAIAWELLTVLRPDVADYRTRLADVLRQIDAAVVERMPRAALAAQRGELDKATQIYLSVLALQPSNEGAADALRGVERQRNKRNYLGKFSRATLTRRAVAESEMASNDSAPSGGMPGRIEIERASLLAGDGDFDHAIELLERCLVLDPKDLGARRVLSNVLYRKAESLLSHDRPGAVAALEKSARIYPRNLQATNRLRQLNGAVDAAGASATQGGVRAPR